ncbi:MAG: GDSL-type esterase/lipase family protein [Verrucomicrobiae bacterium]|nr:GDSL-type esterase/lipase family protein [Verrucomicrobiae bacterium]
MKTRFHQRIEEKTASAKVPPVLVVALGDSVTQGCMEIDVIDPVNVYHNVLKQMLERRHPGATFSVYNAGVGGDNAAGGLKRLKRDVIRHDPDLVIVGFCLNDACAGRKGLAKYRKNMEAIVNKICAKTQADVIILTPNFMASKETPGIAEEHRHFAKTILGCQNEGILKAYVDELRDLARSLKVPVADVHTAWEKMAAAGEDVNAMLCNGLNHPDVPRQRLIAETAMAVLESGLV